MTPACGLQLRGVCSMFTPLRWCAGAGEWHAGVAPSRRTRRNSDHARPSPVPMTGACGPSGWRQPPATEGRPPASPHRTAPRVSRVLDPRRTMPPTKLRGRGGRRVAGTAPRRSATVFTGAAPPTRLQPAVSGFDDRRDTAFPAARPDRPPGRGDGCADRSGRPVPVLRCRRLPESSAVGPAASPCKPILPPPPRRCAREGRAPEFATT